MRWGMRVMLSERLAGVLVLLLAAWQFYSFKKAVQAFKAHAGSNNNVFVGYGLWFGLFFGLILLFLGGVLLLALV